MTTEEEVEFHELATQLAQLTWGHGWEAGRYMAIGLTMQKLATYCAVEGPVVEPACATGAALELLSGLAEHMPPTLRGLDCARSLRWACNELMKRCATRTVATSSPTNR